MSLNKEQLVQAILSQLKTEFDAMTLAARASHEAATHSESKAEDQHDTRGLEASYLAGAQAHRAAELSQQIAFYRSFAVRAFDTGDSVEAGALLELSQNGKRFHYFLVPQGGGMSVQLDGKKIQVITPHAPLGEALLGKSQGDSVEVDLQGTTREYELVSIK
jgi:transcription elongation GreA/GreB family factor